MDFWLMWGVMGSVLVGPGLWMLWNTLTKPRAPKVAEYLAADGLEKRYERTRILLPWTAYLSRSATYGALFAIAGYLGVMNPAVLPGLFVFGFVYVYCAEENRRDTFIMDYNAELAQTISYIINAFSAKESIDNALEVAATYASGAVGEDLNAIRADGRANLSREQAVAP